MNPIPSNQEIIVIEIICNCNPIFQRLKKYSQFIEHIFASAEILFKIESYQERILVFFKEETIMDFLETMLFLFLNKKNISQPSKNATLSGSCLFLFTSKSHHSLRVINEKLNERFPIPMNENVVVINDRNIGFDVPVQRIIEVFDLFLDLPIPPTTKKFNIVEFEQLTVS